MFHCFSLVNFYIFINFISNIIEKVKQVKCYKKVWENIRKYNKAAVDKNLVMVKYILIPGFNDNYEEINKWFDEVVKNGVAAVSLSVEQDWYANHQPEFTPEIYELLIWKNALKSSI